MIPCFPHPMMGRQSLTPTSPTFNPADKAANISLSGGNLTAAATASGTFANVRSTSSHNSGKFHVEFTIGPDSGSGVGGAVAGASLVLGFGTTADGFALYDNGNLFIGGSLTASGITFTTGDIIAVELDFTGNQVFFQKFGGSRSSAFSLAGMTAGAIFMGVSIQNSGNSVTLNVGASSFSIAPTAGFGFW